MNIQTNKFLINNCDTNWEMIQTSEIWTPMSRANTSAILSKILL